MTSNSRSGAVGVSSRAYWSAALLVGSLHLILLWLDWSDGAGFFRADRVPQRLANILALIERPPDGPESLASVLASRGNIGDYGFHAVLMAISGRMGVTVVQVLLALASVFCVVNIALRASGSPRVALASGLLYGLLPQSLAFPHQLLSEAFSNPLLIFGVAAFGAALQKGSLLRTWVISGLCFGLAGLVRPALLPLPVLAVLLLAIVERVHWRRVAGRAGGFMVASAAPFVLWSLFMLVQTGHFGLGESNQDLGLNLSQSTAKVLLTEGVGGPDGSAPAWLPARLTLPEYATYVVTYPAGFLNLYTKNFLVMIADSGIGRLYVDLLGNGAEARAALQDPVTGWRAQLTNHGVMAMLSRGFETAPGTIVAGLLGAALFAAVTFGMVAGYVAMLSPGSPLRSNARQSAVRWTHALLLVLPLYVLCTSQVVAYAPSRLRSQSEFAWAILACIGWVFLRRLRAARKTESLEQHENRQR
jgi:4-amino-4-deoxy-L-arabinose transferase-like glycosyltransferase